MFEKVKSDQAAEKAAGLFADKYHCAEAVVAASLEALGVKSQEAISHATPFGGGFGRTYMETCGVLSGSMIVLGHLFGRRSPGESWDIPADLGAEIRRRFLARHDTSTCLDLRGRFGGDEPLDECREVVREGVRELLEFLQSEECSRIIVKHRETAVGEAERESEKRREK